MPSIPIFLADQDLDALSEMLGSDSEIAIISSESEAPKLKLWHAYDQLPLVSGKSYCLWHMPSGPVVVQGERKGDPDWIEVEDPFGGWLAYPYSNDWDLPNVGNKPQFFTLRIDVDDERNPGCLGLSHLSWIGSRYGSAPPQSTKWWRSLRTRVRKRSKLVYGNGINSHEECQFDCWPSAFAQIGTRA